MISSCIERTALYEDISLDDLQSFARKPDPFYLNQSQFASIADFSLDLFNRSTYGPN